MTIRRNKDLSSPSVLCWQWPLSLLGVGFFFLLMYMGGQHETKNAVDAGTLNIGKQTLDQITVNLDGSPSQQCYMDVTNDADDGSLPNDGKVDLRRINRVWAKAMLIGINADAAEKDGLAGSGESNADQAIQGAQAISTALTQQLTTPTNLYHLFYRLFAIKQCAYDWLRYTDQCLVRC